jgi:RNA recognition motif-containing protein
MNNKLYVSNLAFAMRDADLEKVFVPFGQVVSAKVIKDRVSGRSKGFGFVEMASDDEAMMAIKELNGKDVEGRVLRVLVATPKTDNVVMAREGSMSSSNRL